MEENIITLKERNDEIGIFVDETCFLHSSGLIQVGLPVPSAADRGFQRDVESLRSEMARRKLVTFKASELNNETADLYAEFLRFIFILLGAIAEQTPLRGVVSIEAEACYKGREYRNALSAVKMAFQNLGIASAPASRQFARQVLWLERHFDNLCRSPIDNPFHVLVDKKFNDDKECTSLKPTLSPTLGVFVWWEHHKQLTGMLNYLIQNHRNGRWSPQFSDFRFEDDKLSVYLQAADLIAHLFYNALKFEKGIDTDGTRLKNSILRSVYDGPLDSTVLSALEVVATRGGGRELILKNNRLSGRMTLLPRCMETVGGW